jgi:putative ABC transport system permease protein
MNVTDTVQLALRNLGQAKLRTALTTLGVSIGIASLAGMVSLGVGLQDQFVGRFMASGVFDAVTVMPARPAGRGFLGRGGGGGRRGAAAGPRGQGAGETTPATPETPPAKLDDAAIAAIAALEQVKVVYPNVRVQVQIKYEQFAESSTATGVPLSAKDDGAFQTLAYGAFFRDDSAAACLLSLDMAKRISDKDPKDLIGQTLTLSYAAAPAGGEGTALALPGTGSPMEFRRVETPYTIAGIVERETGPGFGGGLVSGVMIPLGRAKDISASIITSPQALLREPAERAAYSTLTVRVKSAQFTQDVEDKIKGMGYSVFSVNDMLENAKKGFIILDIVLSLIGSIALAVSSLGIVNTMVMSILERTREIGIMKAVGGSDADIRGIFLVEASTIGVMGGLAGVTLGWLVGRVINIGANIYIRSQGGTDTTLFALPFWLIGGAIGFSLVVSLIAGSYPAARAARLDPIQALRHD